MSSSSGKANCPVCFSKFSTDVIETHVNQCIESRLPSESHNDGCGESKKKKMKVDVQAWGCLARGAQVQGHSKNDSSTINKIKSPSSLKHARELDKKAPVGVLQENDSAHAVQRANELNGNVPLAEQMRPKTFDTYFGQESAVGNKSVLRTLLSHGNIPSMILWGPPGCGKTSLVNIIKQECKSKQSHKFHKLSATNAGVADVKKIVNIAHSNLQLFKMKTILFVDEIHRFNKLQQDTFLPHVEDGTIILLGATTENPSFSLNNALMSRCKIIKLEALTHESVRQILKSAFDFLHVSLLKPNEEVDHLILASSRIFIEFSAFDMLVNISNGDARLALNTLEISVKSKVNQTDELKTKPEEISNDMENSKQCHNSSTNSLKSRIITNADIKKSLLTKHFYYDRSGDEHYNCISALIKSMRGSDANAALYWMCRMISGGEDPKFIARRMVIFASEDVGLADPQALNLAVSTYQSCQVIGLPECGIVLAECAVYLARAPKSVESYMAYNRAMTFIKEFDGPQPGVPLHLRNAPTQLLKDMECGKGYIYPPTNTENQQQSYLPDSLADFNCFADK